MIDMSQWNGAGDVDPAFVLLAKRNIWRRFVHADSKPFQFCLDDPFIRKRLVDVEDDEYEMARLSHSNYLSATTLAVLCALDDTREIEDLDFGSIVDDLAGHRGKGSELVRRGFRMLSCEATHQGTLANGWKSDEANTSNTGTGNVETDCFL